MNALHEPYLLSSYTPPLRSITKGSFVVDVTCVEYDHKGFATVTVQGDGIHILETSEMRPVISHTLGPETRFICPSVTQIDESGTLSTYAVTSRPNASNEGSEYFLQRWTGSLMNNATRPSEQKFSPNFIEDIHRLYTLPKLPSKLVALSVSGHIYVLSTESLAIDQFFRHSTSDSILFRSFSFPLESCTFASQLMNPDGTLIIRFYLANGSLFMNLCSLSSVGIKEIATIHLCNGEGVVDLICSTSGYIIVLASSGTWSIFRLDVDEQGRLMKEAIVINKHSHSKTATSKYRGFALTSITSSFVLLACIEGSTNLHFTLLDLRFSVVLATQTFTLPSNLTTGPKNSLQISLVTARQTEVVIRVSPSKESGAPSPSRSAIFILPITVSTSSSIALAMGKASEAPVWLPKPKLSLSREEAMRQGLLTRIEGAVKKGLPHEADTIFFTWVEEETARAEMQDRVIVDRFGRRFPTRPRLPKLSYRFVTTLLDIVLQPAKASDIPFSSKIPLYLIERKAVSDNMIQGGFVSTLRRKGDWKSICSALQNMADIPEQEVIHLLIKVLASHKRSLGATAGDAMDIEPSDDGIPTLANFLPMVIQYQSSSPAACYALKTCFSDVDDVILILQELDRMLETVCKQNLANSAADAPPLPPLRFIFSFMQYIFDAHFLTLLQHPPTRPLLKQISGRLHESLFTLQEFDYLREPLNTIIHAQALARHTGQRESKRDRKKDSFNNVVQLYQIEELAL